MRILVTGSTGLIGTALQQSLRAAGSEVHALVRGGKIPAAGVIHWDPAAGIIDSGELENFDAVVHLAGENIAGGRWTSERKRTIRESRVKGTELLIRALLRLDRPPRCLVSASAIGYYGDRGEERLREDSTSGDGFLPSVCREWENAALPAEQKGIRLVRLRIGIVLSAAGGALKEMLAPFRLGLGGRLGSGRQFMSWIALDDLVAVIQHALRNDSLSGAINAVAPAAVRNEEFTTTLGRVLGRPTVFAMPGFAARLALGEMADALLLASTRVEPAMLMKSNFQYGYPELEAALRHCLGKAR